MGRHIRGVQALAHFIHRQQARNRFIGCQCIFSQSASSWKVFSPSNLEKLDQFLAIGTVPEPIYFVWIGNPKDLAILNAILRFLSPSGKTVSCGGGWPYHQCECPWQLVKKQTRCESKTYLRSSPILASTNDFVLGDGKKQ